MSVEGVVRCEPETLDSFFRANQREALAAFYEFPVVWHERRYGFCIREGDHQIAGATLKVAASLGHVERIVVAPASRRRGLGRALLEAMTETSNYYNAHKMTVTVPHLRAAQKFFEACDYHVEAILPQHTYKLDMAVLRRFLL